MLYYQTGINTSLKIENLDKKFLSVINMIGLIYRENDDFEKYLQYDILSEHISTGFSAKSIENIFKSYVYNITFLFDLATKNHEWAFAIKCCEMLNYIEISKESMYFSRSFYKDMSRIYTLKGSDNSLCADQTLHELELAIFKKFELNEVYRLNNENIELWKKFLYYRELGDKAQMIKYYKKSFDYYTDARHLLNECYLICNDPKICANFEIWISLMDHTGFWEEEYFRISEKVVKYLSTSDEILDFYQDMYVKHVTPIRKLALEKETETKAFDMFTKWLQDIDKRFN